MQLFKFALIDIKVEVVLFEDGKHWCSSLVSPSFQLMCITMLSMYMVSSPLAIWVQNKVFIIT